MRSSFSITIPVLRVQDGQLAPLRKANFDIRKGLAVPLLCVQVVFFFLSPVGSTKARNHPHLGIMDWSLNSQGGQGEIQMKSSTL